MGGCILFLLFTLNLSERKVVIWWSSLVIFIALIRTFARWHHKVWCLRCGEFLEGDVGWVGTTNKGELNLLISPWILLIGWWVNWNFRLWRKIRVIGSGTLIPLPLLLWFKITFRSSQVAQNRIHKQLRLLSSPCESWLQRLFLTFQAAGWFGKPHFCHLHHRPPGY